jgi:hypothetical protein
MNPDADLEPAVTSTQKNVQRFFCILLFEGTFTSFIKDKQSYRSHKTDGINVFLTIFAEDRRIRIRISANGSGSGRFKNMFLRIRIWIRIGKTVTHTSQPTMLNCISKNRCKKYSSSLSNVYSTSEKIKRAFENPTYFQMRLKASSCKKKFPFR